jgi:hypothetical protein
MVSVEDLVTVRDTMKRVEKEINFGSILPKLKSEYIFFFLRILCCKLTISDYLYFFK